MEDASNHTMFFFEMRSRLKLSFLFNCLEMEAQAPTRSTTSEQGKKARWLSLCCIFLFYSKILPTQSFFSQLQSARGRREGLLGCSIGKDGNCISCR
jgi:hypothetical protein